MQDIFREKHNELGERPHTPLGDQRRRSLIIAAYQVIAEKGFERLRTREVATRAGVNIATLHYYFASKEDLIQGVADYLLQLFATTHVYSMSEQMTPWDHVCGMLTSTQYLLHEKQEMFIVLMELALHSLRDPSAQASIQRLNYSWSAALEAVIEEGIRQGMFYAELNPKEVATQLISLIKGSALHQITGSKTMNIESVLHNIQRWLVRPQQLEPKVE